MVSQIRSEDSAWKMLGREERRRKKQKTIEERVPASESRLQHNDGDVAINSNEVLNGSIGQMSQSDVPTGFVVLCVAVLFNSMCNHFCKFTKHERN